MEIVTHPSSQNTIGETILKPPIRPGNLGDTSISASGKTFV